MVATILTIFNGCQKDELGVSQPANEAQPQAVVTNPMFIGLSNIAFSVEDNRLVFESEKEYQKCIDFLAKLGDKNFPAFEKEIDFNSYRKVFEDDDVKSEVFVDDLYQTLLNPEMEIVIGDYLFRENPGIEMTLAFQLAGDEDCTLKNAVLSSPTFTFSWRDDAFAILTEDKDLSLKSVTADYCNSNNDDKEKNFIVKSGNWGNTTYHNPFAYYFDLKAKLCFQKTAIFKSIITKFKIETSDFQCYNSYWDGFENCRDGVYARASFESVGNALYKRKRETAFNAPVSDFFYPHMSEDVISWRPFYGTKKVEYYNITMDFKFSIYAGAVYPHDNQYVQSERLSIRCNI